MYRKEAEEQLHFEGSNDTQKVRGNTPRDMNPMVLDSLHFNNFK